jgi:hypothetical protein
METCPVAFGSQDITLKKGGEEGSIITSMETFGMYDIMVEDANDKENGTRAFFSILATKDRGGKTFRSVSTVGKHEEHLMITWDPSQKPVLKYMKVPTGTDSPVEQTFRVVFRTIQRGTSA